MPLNSYLRQKFGGGNLEYTKDGNKDMLYNRDEQSTTEIKKRDFTPIVPSTINPRAQSISSGNENMLGTNQIPMKMFKSKVMIAANRG